MRNFLAARLAILYHHHYPSNIFIANLLFISALKDEDFIMIIIIVIIIYMHKYIYYIVDFMRRGWASITL